MTVPSRAEAARLLLSFEPPAWHQRHSRAVAEVAAWLARRIEQRQIVDRTLVESAALLHDIDKAMPKGARLAAATAAPTRAGHEQGAVAQHAQHGAIGGAWLAVHGYPELVEAVTLHPVTRLAERDGWAELERASPEARVVAYADKRAQQRLVPMAARFARWDRRHPDGWTRAVRDEVWTRARALEDEVCERAACRPADVARLAWTAVAFGTARSSPGGTG